MEPLGQAPVQSSWGVWNCSRIGFEHESLTACTNGHRNGPLNWLKVVIVTTAERVGQRLHQDVWDQVRRLIKNLPG